MAYLALQTKMTEQQHIEQSPSSRSTEDDGKAELFSMFLSTLYTEQLSLLASAILQRFQLLYQTTNAKFSVDKPLYGSYYVPFPLNFDDIGLRWFAKTPINDTASKWDELSASALISEANTMRLLKRETTIPLPDGLDFSTTQNTLRCPYITMAFIYGVSLNDASLETTHLRRIHALERHRLGNGAAGQVLISNR